MTRKTVGYVELEWTCKRCGTRNPGTEKICSGCSSVMSEEDQFEAPVQQELITDEAKLARVEQGPDVHCPYCGARSPAGSEKCSQCGAGLADAAAREKGRVVGAFKAEPVPDVPCPYCATSNPANATKCRECGGNLKKPVAARPAPQPRPVSTGLPKALVFGVIAAILLCVVVMIVLGSRTADTSAVVQSVGWERTIEIMEERPVEDEAWEDEIPVGAQKGSCAEKHRSTQPEPAPGAREVCGTPYTIDQGDGTGKVVQDCEYEIYDNWCNYTVDEWTVVDKAVAEGNDLNPHWPNVQLRSDQREGDRLERYKVIFRADDKQDTYTYRVNSVDELSKFAVGSRWTLKVNTFGGVNEVQPAR